MNGFFGRDDWEKEMGTYCFVVQSLDLGRRNVHSTLDGLSAAELFCNTVKMER